ncbi:hypothetical protein PQI07_22440 [Methylobacterium sp. 092160098-2]|uniref:hypothetical protein n=1 Tax=Methylobacterium sp. 092160098-2 TaxID=3025129 RepID=UPI002381BE94|nr:hypothetical protein [Methylobacterium sp. 092160098-2]MDE4913442.1 hypothetical protein [Methylobacterium sp. 092160098-2]
MDQKFIQFVLTPAKKGGYVVQNSGPSANFNEFNFEFAGTLDQCLMFVRDQYVPLVEAPNQPPAPGMTYREMLD